MKNMTRVLSLTLALLLLLTGCASKPQTPEAAETDAPAAVLVDTVNTDGFTMDYLRFGRGERTLVILPGLAVQSVMGSAEAVAEAYAPLTEDFTIYLFERRNELPESYSIRDMAVDTAAAFQALGLKDICLFGVSMGGMIALELAAQHADLVDKLALGSTAAAVTDTLDQTLDAWLRLAKAGDAEALYLAFGERVYPREVYEQSKELLVSAAATVTEADLARFAILAESMKGYDVTEHLSKIACPVLAIGAQDDQVLGVDAAEQIAAAFDGHADFEVYLYDGYGHAAYDLAPDYKDRLLQFFTA